jgi:hypothetical protein
MKRVLIACVSLLIIVHAASALKVSARKTYDFEPDKTIENRVCVFPENLQRVKLEPEGSISEYIHLDTTVAELDEGWTCFPYEVRLPENMNRPGIHKGGIKATEMPADQEGQIVALISISHQIYIDVPYPGTYVVPSIDAKHTDAGENVPLSVTLENKGNETVRDVRGEITIIEGNSSVDTVGMKAVDAIPGTASEELTAYWNSSGFEVGDYRARLDVLYDGNTTTVADSFKLGTVDVRLNGYTRNVTKDGVVPYTVRVESYWSDAIEDVKATIEIDNNPPVSFETLTKTLDAWERKTLEGYVDTSDLTPGEHNVTIEVGFANKSRSYDARLDVLAPPSEESPSAFIGSSTTHVLLYTTIVLALLAVILTVKVVRD